MVVVDDAGKSGETPAIEEHPVNERQEWERVVRIEGRLESGQKEFSGMREHIRRIETQVADLREAAVPKPLGRMQLLAFILGPIIGVSVLLGGYVWQVAKYPNREEFNESVREQVNAQIALAARTQGVENRQALQAANLQTMDATIARLENAIARLADKMEKKK